MKDFKYNIFSDKLETFLNFIEKQKENKNGIKYKNLYLDALFLKDDSKTKLITEISNSDNIKDLWISTVLRVVIINKNTIKKIVSEIGKISYESYKSGILLENVKAHYLYDDVFFGNDYMPLLIRGNTKQEKADKFIDILDKMMAISNTIQFDNSMSSVINQLQSKSNISSFYSNYIVVRFNSLTNHLVVDDIHLGPGSLKTMNYILSKKPKNHKAEMYVLKALQKKIKETNNIELELYDIEKQMCEFQKTL